MNPRISGAGDRRVGISRGMCNHRHTQRRAGCESRHRRLTARAKFSRKRAKNSETRKPEDLISEFKQKMQSLKDDPEMETEALDDFSHMAGYYTPANVVSFCDAEEDVVEQHVVVEVDAPASRCFSMLNDWAVAAHVFDLVHTVIPLPEDSNSAFFQCFYRFGKMPILQIVFCLKKEDVEENRHIRCQATEGMPMALELLFEEKDDAARTTVTLTMQHAMPTVIKEWVGWVAFGLDVRDILRENMQVFKLLAEGKLEPDQLEEYYAANRRNESGEPEDLPMEPFEDEPSASRP